ncbi:GrpB family protein [Gorillibacterium timonense]|uniref:GrpB family protein n=1 Tax=Gorillibacterium timonense TaxID=1689269 RepID=UPI00071E2073|nr:GrpB family protein [Gorillibacterium timonense]
MGKSLSEMTLEELWQLFPIVLKEHNPMYKEWYLAEKEEILRAVGSATVKRINHIGSTSVEGLVAKPTVDILLEIGADCDLESLKQNLKAAGWTCMSWADEPAIRASFNKGYTPQGFAEKVYHLHVRRLGDWDELYFRDYLRDHREVAEEYERLKTGLKEQYEHDRDGYTNAKTDFIKGHMAKARAEYPDRYKL